MKLSMYSKVKNFRVVLITDEYEMNIITIFSLSQHANNVIFDWLLP